MTSRTLAVVATRTGVVELNYMWLPTWIGMNAALKREIEQELSSFFVGKVLTDDLLLEGHGLVLEFLAKKFPTILGLRSYLEGLRYIGPP